MSTELLRLPSVLRRTGNKKTKLYALIKSGEFPRPIQLAARTVAWVSDDVDQWIAERIAAARSAVQNRDGKQ